MTINIHQPSVAVIVATYNKASYLAVTLRQLARQTTLPNEIVIADDGSGKNTQDVIKAFSVEFPSLNVKHSWHKDQGFRKCAALNKAIRAATSDYVLFIDDDCACPAYFITNHLARTTQGSFTVGSSIHLNNKITQNILDLGNISGFLNLPKQTKFQLIEASTPRRRLKLFWRIALSGVAVGRIFDRFYIFSRIFRGGNSGAWLQDLIKVNGFNEDMTYGHEDKELGIRLQNAGLKLRQVRYTAVNYHLHHDRTYVDQKVRKTQELQCRKMRKSGQKICKNGLILL